jgi:hypothetical protein
LIFRGFLIIKIKVAEAHYFDAAPAQGKNFDAALAASAPAVPHTKPFFSNQQKLI